MKKLLLPALALILCASTAGADVIEAPVDQGYGVREYGARDPEGHLWFFHSPLG